MFQQVYGEYLDKMLSGEVPIKKDILLKIVSDYITYYLFPMNIGLFTDWTEEAVAILPSHEMVLKLSDGESEKVDERDIFPNRPMSNQLFLCYDDQIINRIDIDKVYDCGVIMYEYKGEYFFGVNAFGYNLINTHYATLILDVLCAEFSCSTKIKQCYEKIGLKVGEL